MWLFISINSQRTAILNSQDFGCGGIKSVQFDSFYPSAVPSIVSRAACIPGKYSILRYAPFYFLLFIISPNCLGWPCTHYLAQANPKFATLYLRLQALPPDSTEAMILRLLFFVVCILRQQVCLKTQTCEWDLLS